MVVTMCLLSSVLVALPPDESDWLLLPQLRRGQEFLYTGTYTEEFAGSSVRLTRKYSLESRVLVLDTPPSGADVVLLTVLKFIPACARDTGPQESAEQGSVRLESARVNLQGRLSADPGLPLLVPLEGPTTIECGAFVELPGHRLGPGQSWEVTEEGRPPRTWRLVGAEMVNGTRCCKLVGVQQSEDWVRPRADRTAWRRQDLVWLEPEPGVAAKIERTIVRREPAQRQATQRSVTSFELKGRVVYPEQLLDDCRYEIRQARLLAQSAAPLLRQPGKYDARSFETLLTRIAFHVEHQPRTTPYREAILQIKRRLEAAGSGQAAPADDSETSTPAHAVAAVGQPAPDFVADNLTNKGSTRLSRLLGRPILLLFYSPASATAQDVLRFGQGLVQANGSAITVLGLVADDNQSRAIHQAAELDLSFPVLSGTTLVAAYGVENTPQLILLDALGVVRGSYVGWGTGTAQEVREELARCLRGKRSGIRGQGPGVGEAGP